MAVVRSTFILSGTVSDFNQESFKSNLAVAYPGITTNDITLIVTSASVRVRTIMIAPNATYSESP